MNSLLGKLQHVINPNASSSGATDDIEDRVPLQPDSSNATGTSTSTNAGEAKAAVLGFLNVAKEKVNSAVSTAKTKAGEVKTGATAKAESLKRVVTGDADPNDQQSAWDEFNEQMTLSRKNRLIGFGISLGLGLFFSVLSSFFIPLIVIKPHKFAVCYTVGNIMLLSSTFFLMGPTNQMKSMMKGNRYIASLVYVGALIGTMVAALWLQMGLLVLVFIGAQFLALVWYALSYIPFGHTLARKFVTKILNRFS